MVWCFDLYDGGVRCGHTPPVAINVYVVQGVTKVPMEDIFRGVLPFIFVYLIAIGFIVAFPEISFFLPRTMK